VARDTTGPSPLSHEIINARPYAFLDDAPLEERRALAVQTRRSSDDRDTIALGVLDASAIAMVREEAWPDPHDADEAARRAGQRGLPDDRRGRARAGLDRVARGTVAIGTRIAGRARRVA
jgi:ATP-dependent Lhr-like helicase